MLEHGRRDDGRLVSISYPEFKQVMQESGLPFLAENHELFDVCDIDPKNNALDYREIALLLHLLGLFSTEEIVKHFVFTLIDLDGNHSLDAHEIFAAIGKLMLEVIERPPRSSPRAVDGAASAVQSDSAAAGDGASVGVRTESSSDSQTPVDISSLEVLLQSVSAGEAIDEKKLFDFFSTGDKSRDRTQRILHEYLFGPLKQSAPSPTSPSPREVTVTPTPVPTHTAGAPAVEGTAQAGGGATAVGDTVNAPAATEDQAGCVCM